MVSVALSVVSNEVKQRIAGVSLTLIPFPLDLYPEMRLLAYTSCCAFCRLEISKSCLADSVVGLGIPR